MSVLVTGGLGVNGAPVLRKLVERGLRPIVIDLRPDLSLPDPETVADTEIVLGDFTDAKLVGDLLERHEIRTIIHMAAIVANA